jgi:hypothetical protein
MENGHPRRLVARRGAPAPPPRQPRRRPLLQVEDNAAPERRLADAVERADNVAPERAVARLALLLEAEVERLLPLVLEAEVERPPQLPEVEVALPLRLEDVAALLLNAARPEEALQVDVVAVAGDGSG